MHTIKKLLILLAEGLGLVLLLALSFHWAHLSVDGVGQRVPPAATAGR
ncbi:MAG: hypothetical protein IPM29_29575 [Planctomycetes bacterium]|nr:hypothetical protein [Planctomycetota bacterium]